MKAVKRELRRLMFEFRQKRYWYLPALFLLLTGICAGCRYHACLSVHGAVMLEEYIDAALLLLRSEGYPCAGAYFYTLLPYLLMYAAVAAACLHPLLTPLVGAVCVTKGFCFGFFFASLLCAGVTGSFTAALVLLPTKLLCAAFLTAACAQTLAALPSQLRQRRYVKRRLMPSAALFSTAKCLFITAAFVLFEVILPMRALTV